MLNFKGMRFPVAVILVCIRWYAAYPLSYRHLEEMTEERGMSVGHSTINRWAIRFLPVIEKMARKHKRPIGDSWRMDETYIEVKGVWKSLYRAVDKQGKTVDSLLTGKGDMAAAKRSATLRLDDCYHIHRYRYGLAERGCSCQLILTSVLGW